MSSARQRRPQNLERPSAPWLLSLWSATIAAWIWPGGRLFPPGETSARAAPRPKLHNPRHTRRRKRDTARHDAFFVLNGSGPRSRASAYADSRSRTWLGWLALSWASLRYCIFEQPTPTTKDSEPTLPPLRQCTCSRQGRNLVVCIDGTSNQFSTNNTNVVELYSRLIKDENQLTFYNSGIGTYATPSWRSLKYYFQVISNKLDLAFAFNFERILLSAYLWLSENYRPGDRIFLFGFSRGAYQVRGLAAMIDQVGLIHKGNQDQIPFAYQLYAETKKVKDAAKMRAHFKKTFSHTDVCIHYAGLWDTVSSVGLIRDKTLPGTTDGLRFICFVRHALSLHDRRIKFLPEYVHGGDGPLEDEVDESGDRPPHTKEVWFAGSHGDVGGGSIENSDMNQFGPALRWVSFEALVAGLRLSEAPQDWNNNAPIVHDSLGLNPIWHLLEVLPITHLTYTDSTSTRTLPHFRRSRKIRARQSIHETALTAQSQLPYAELSDDIQWDDRRASDNISIERDPYTTAQSVLARLEKYSDEGSAMPTQAEFLALTQLISTEPGRRSLRDSKNAESILTSVLRAYSAETALEDIPSTLFDIVFELETMVADYSESSHRVPHGDLVSLKQIRKPIKHAHSVRCMAQWPTGDRIVTGCTNGSLYISNTRSGEIVGDPLEGHGPWVLSVAVSPDGTRIASGSEDLTIRVWTVAEPRTPPIVLEGHTGKVFSVAFSPNGLYIASGAGDNSVRIWEVATWVTVVGPINAHGGSVHSVVYSPDGLRIVTGSLDGNVRVWDAQTGDYLRQTVLFLVINALSHSPDGKLIAAACENGSLCILDADTCVIVWSLYTGFESVLCSVAFSPDSKNIVTASTNGDIQLWSAETGEQQYTVRGHCYSVLSAAYSSDGKSVISAALDKTVRFWDVTRG